jgi:NAD(P)H dehydrogenase (quinone)
VESRRISDDDVRSTLRSFGMSAAQVDAIVMMTAGIRDDYTPELPRVIATTTPTALKSWAATHLA